MKTFALRVLVLFMIAYIGDLLRLHRYTTLSLMALVLVYFVIRMAICRYLAAKGD